MRNEETVKYLNIMVESLQKKKLVINQMLEKTMLQSELISSKEYDDVNWSQFEVLMVEKESLIEKINELDDGFEQLFSRVKPDLDADKDSYAEEIRKLQGCITELTDTGVRISATEERNRQDINRIMTSAKVGIGKARKSIKANSGYITSMYGGQPGETSSQIDSKK